MRLVQGLLLSHERFWRKFRRRLRRYYYSLTLEAMGKDCQICDGVLITDPEFTCLGDRVNLNEGVILLTFNKESSIKIGNDVTLSYAVNVITGGLDLTHGVNNAKHQYSSVMIEDRVWIGAKAIILPGVTIGTGAVIAAGSVVRSDVTPRTMVAGVPARLVKELPASGEL